MTDVELDARITALEDTNLTNGEFCVYFLESHKPISLPLNTLYSRLFCVTKILKVT